MNAKMTHLMLVTILPFAFACRPGFAHPSSSENGTGNDVENSLQVSATTVEEKLVPFTDANGQVHELWVTEMSGPKDAKSIGVYSSTAERENDNSVWRMSADGNNRSRIIMESPNVLQVREGQHCEDSFSTGRNDSHVVAPGSEQLPDYATQATIVLNGWRLLFIDESVACTASNTNAPCFIWKQNPPAVDHHLFQTGLFISEIEKIGNVLHWRAAGGLADKTNNDPVGMCYTYNVIAWNDSRLDLYADIGHEDDWSCYGNEMDKCTYDRSFLNPAPNPAASVAILPRGFAFNWYLAENHHLLQIARAFRILGRVETAGSRRIHFESTNIWKDNSRRAFSYQSGFIGLGGTDLDIIQPSFPISPREKSKANACISDAKAFVVTDVEVDVPFEFALPVLSGWDLWHPCDDEHVAEMGIWLHDIEFDKKGGEATGTLRYKVSSVFRDADGKPGHRSRPMVSILGLNAPRSMDPAILGLMINRVLRRATP